MTLVLLGIREQLERHLWVYYNVKLSDIDCRKVWQTRILDYRNQSMDVDHRDHANRVFLISFNGVSFEEFQEAVNAHRGTVNDCLLIEVLEELVREKSKQQAVEVEK